MTSSKPAISVGKPFQKGEDPRRNKNGRISKDRAAWAAKFNNALAELMPPEQAATIFVEEIKRRRSWAILELFRRLLGEPVKSVEISGSQDNQLIIKVIEVKE